MPLDIPAISTGYTLAPVHYFPSIDSTMHRAVQLAAGGADHGTAVLADEQTAGMGRLGRSWISETDAGIYCSVVLRPSLSAGELPVATLMLGLATVEAIEAATELACDLRWPNDVLIAERKVAGILAQFTGTAIIAGIGINVNQTSFPPDLRTPATSLRLASGNRAQSREPIVITLLNQIHTLVSVMASRGSGEIIRAFAARSSYVSNRRIVLEDTGQHGTTAGLDGNGFLLVRFDSGQTERVAAGGIRPEQ